MTTSLLHLRRQKKKSIRHLKVTVCDQPASKSAAVTEEIPPDLQAVIDAWPPLPEPVQAGIIAMVRAARSSGDE
jgi:hypothetical protein